MITYKATKIDGCFCNNHPMYSIKLDGNLWWSSDKCMLTKNQLKSLLDIITVEEAMCETNSSSLGDDFWYSLMGCEE